MQQLDYYNKEEEIELRGNVYICEVTVTGHIDYNHGDGHTTPPEESFHYVKVVVDNVVLVKDNLFKVMNFQSLKDLLSAVPSGEDLLGSTL